MRPICVRLEDEAIEALDRKAQVAGQDKSSYLRELILVDLGFLKRRRRKVAADSNGQ